jgi:hypothetical protein
MRSEHGTAVILSIKNSEELPKKLDFHWFQVDQWSFEVFERGICVSHIKLPQENVFPANSIFIGSRSTNEVSRCLGAGFVFSASRYPRITCFQKTRFSLVPGRPMGFRGEWTSDSNSPHRVTYRNIESCQYLSPFRQCSFDPVTNRQTDRQTNLFNFVRPSFQSRE